MATSQTLSKHSGDPFPDGELYRQVVGALQYITMTRPDVSFSINHFFFETFFYKSFVCLLDACPYIVFLFI